MSVATQQLMRLWQQEAVKEFTAAQTPGQFQMAQIKHNMAVKLGKLFTEQRNRSTTVRSI